MRLLLADRLFKNRRRDEALHTLDTARELYRQVSDRIGLGNCELKLGDWLVAPLSASEVWNTFLEESTWDDSIHWQTENTEAQIETARVNDAHVHYQNAARHFEAEGSIRGIAATEMRFGFLNILEGMSRLEFEVYFTRAKERVAESANLFVEAGDIMGYQICLAQISLCEIGEGSLPEDTETAISIGNWGRTQGSFGFALGIGIFLARLGRRWHIHIGDHERALACFRLSYSLFKELGAGISQVHTIVDQMSVYEVLGDYASFARKGEEALQKCKELQDADPNHKEDILSQNNWISTRILEAATRRSMSKLVQRIREQIGSQMIGDSSSSEDRPSPGIDLETLSALFATVNVSTDPVAQTEAISRATSQFSPEKLTMTLLRSQLADAEIYQLLFSGKEYNKAGNGQKARECFEKAREKAKSVSGTRRYGFLEALSFAYEGRNSEAELAYQHLLNGELETLNRQMASGLRTPLYEDQRKQTGIRAVMFFCEVKAFKKAKQWLNFLQSWPYWWRNEGQQWQALRRIAQVQEGVGDLESALATYEEAMASFEEQRRRLSIDELKVAFASDSSTQAIFFEGVRVALKRRNRMLEEPRAREKLEARALQAAERGKARSLLDLMACDITDRGQKSNSNMVLRRWRRQNAYLATRSGLLEQELRNKDPDQSKIAALKQSIIDAECLLRGTEREISNTGLLTRMASSDVAQLMSVAGKLASDTLILQYIFNYEQLYIWAINKQGMVKVHEKILKEYLLDRETKRFRTLCEQGNPAAHLARWLAEELIEPFDELIQSYPKLLIVPSGSLHLLPFHALPWRKAPLSSTHLVSYLPSTSLLEFMVRRSTTNTTRRVLAVGNPSNMSFRQADGSQRPARTLPGAAREAMRIAQTMSGSKALLGPEATLDNLLKDIRNYTILHFATHCRLSAEVPLLSSISLAHGKELTVYELLDHQLDVDLVVLSACQTGKGDATPGDDVVGFSRALLAAGAHAVLVSLWPVDDDATSLLLINFYQRLCSGQPLAQALQGAQNYLRGCSSRVGHLICALDDLESEMTQLGVSQENINQVRSAFRDPAKSTVGVASSRDYSLPKFWAPFVLIGV
ncbi:hypothetical protein CBS11852_3190 [Aspergillus niger]|nr:hypothetical protein CBS11852_3190 [Aspergillus niger]